jgi:hypothetical protein
MPQHVKTALELLAEYDLAHRADAILALAQPCWWLSSRRGKGRSRIGGEPDLPEDLAWPHMDELPLTYLAQLDLAEFPDDRLPREGSLVFFFERSGRYDGIEPCRVIHVRGPTQRRAIPHGLETFEQRRLVGTRGLSFPDFGHESPYVPLVVDREKEREALFDWSSVIDDDLGRRGSHQLLGHARGYQRDTMVAVAEHFPGLEGTADSARHLQLLLQLHDDDESRLDWFGDGNLAFVMQREDLARQRFDRVWSAFELG